MSRHKAPLKAARGSAPNSLKQQMTVSALEQQRQRIAHNLHEHPAQTLALLQLHLGQLQQHPDCESVIPMIKDLRRLAKDASQQLRQVIRELDEERPKTMVIDDALRARVRDMHVRFPGSPSIQLDLRGPSKPLDGKTCTTLLRVVNELLGNLCKHSNAPEALLSSSCQKNWIIVTLADRGCGFDPSRPTDGFGLQSVTSQLRALGARLKIDARTGMGTSIRLMIPRGRTDECHGVTECAQ